MGHSCCLQNSAACRAGHGQGGEYKSHTGATVGMRCRWLFGASREQPGSRLWASSTAPCPLPHFLARCFPNVSCSSRTGSLAATALPHSGGEVSALLCRTALPHRCPALLCRTAVPRCCAGCHLPACLPASQHPHRGRMTGNLRPEGSRAAQATQCTALPSQPNSSSQLSTHAHNLGFPSTGFAAAPPTDSCSK